MTDPNLRSPRHNKPRKGYDIQKTSRPGPEKGYYDSNGYFHPVFKQNAGNPEQYFAGGPRPGGSGQARPSTGGRNRSAGSGHPGQPGHPDSAHVNRTAGSSHARHKAHGKKRRPFFLLKAVLLIVLCISVGLFLHYINGNGTNSNSIIPGAGHNNPSVAAPLNTDSVITYASLITFSDDSTKPLYGKVILLDPGHGGTDSGCVYPSKKPEYTESIINMNIAERTKTALEAQGATVILLRSDDSWISLYHRISLTHLNCLQYADEFDISTISSTDRERLITELCETIQINSDTIDTGGMGIMVGTGAGSDLQLLMNLEKDFTNILYLSIHINSNPTASMHGTQVYYVTDESIITSETNMLANDPVYQNNPSFPVRQDYYGRDGARSESLAQALYGSIVFSAPQMETNSQNVLADNYAVLRENNLTGALIEVGFITNKKDRGYLTDKSSIAQIANGIALGCVNFFTAD